MPRILLAQSVETDYAQFTLYWTTNDYWDGSPRFFENQRNGWVGAAVDGVLHLVLARRFNGSPVRIELWAEEPAIEDEWQDIVEVSIGIPAGAAVRWETWAGESEGLLEIPSGKYRVRTSARGRDQAVAHLYEADEVFDYHLIQLWPSPAYPDEVLRTGSQDAEHWNKVWGGRR